MAGFGVSGIFTIICCKEKHLLYKSNLADMEIQYLMYNEKCKTLLFATKRNEIWSLNVKTDTEFLYELKDKISYDLDHNIR